MRREMPPRGVPVGGRPDRAVQPGLLPDPRQSAAGAARFGRVVADVVAKHMGCWDEESFRNLPEQVKEARALAYLTAMAGAGAWAMTSETPAPMSEESGAP